MLTLSLYILGLPLMLLLARGFYNVFLHPLRRYPGPLLCRASFLPLMLEHCRGDSNRYIEALHRQYGPVVRVEPNLLSYADSRAWSDIYGHRRTEDKVKPRGALPKASFGVRTNLNGVADIINAHKEEDHRRMRRVMNHMFAPSALASEEPLVRRYVDKLITRLRERAARGEEVDMVMWYNYTAFDILGALAFDQDFGCLESGELHPWVANVFRSLKDGFLQRTLKRFPYPLSQLAYRYWTESALTAARKAEFGFAVASAKKRLARGVDEGKHDFMSYMLKNNDDKGLSEGEIISNSAILIIAGSETTGSYLSGVTFNLMMNPGIMEKLTTLIRSTFATDSEITSSSLAQLEYLTAVLKEAGRVYPALPTGQPREVTESGAFIAGKMVPAGSVVFVHPMGASMAPFNFTDPDRFVPERWLKEPPAPYADDNLEASMPFALGPRSCIGQSLAWVEMRLILARLLWNFDLALAPGQTRWIKDQKAFQVWEKTPLKVRVTERK
ncbi:hypothetical protein MAPG_08711 [Magnaporthiopsis poae ATCC 64411]|uniref:Isotrichodermin C-15 hydroxylase n=1 Tax=Magnaporthiopsis poae (strain ATCC 64411 / 73-15) TaxID=644358 RepID=A0A0C4E825_MAGP6|nr:hypothetical protein MAPG_08711 [Magnaporthiopsis poae ATCC 64411]